MEFTGERFVPSEAGQIKYEHLHRYALCMPFVPGKVVLDLASGEGYGAALLSNVATSVTGVDISPEIVEHARHHYYRQNLTFLVGSCEKVPLPDSSVDIVTSFETIEHHDKHEEMMQEIKRVLKPNGILIISSPNRLTYSDEADYSNPFHIRELYYDELSSLLGRYFKHLRVYGQRLATGSFVYSLRESTKREIATYTGGIDYLAQAVPSLSSPIYFIAVCSDVAQIEQYTPESIYLDTNDDLSKRNDEERVQLSKMLQEHARQIGELKSYQDELQRAIAAQSEELNKAREQRELLIAAQSEELSKAREQLELLIAAQSEELNKEREHRQRLEEHLRRQLNELTRQEGELIRQSSELARLHVELVRKNTESEIRSAELGTQKDKLLEIQARLEAAEAATNRQTKALSDKNEKLTKTLDHLAHSEAKIKILDSNLDQRSDELTASLSRIAEMEAGLSAHEVALRELTERLGQQSLRLDSKKEILSWMSTSRSWKLTAPLRKLSLLWQRPHRWLRQSSQVVIHGSLDFPANDAKVLTYLEVAGWAYSTEAPIAQVEAFVDNVRLGELHYGEERFDVVSTYSSQAPLQCGFSKRFFLDEFLTGRKVLLIRVTNELGTFRDYTHTVTLEVPTDQPPAPISLSIVKPEGEATQIRAVADTLSSSKQSFELCARISLDSVLALGTPIKIPQYEQPEVSIILVLHNRAELTLQCLYSILRCGLDSYEVVIVDNASADATQHLLRTIKGARIIENETNVHFLKACNQAAEQIRGDYLLLLNNDAQLIPGSVASALRTFEGSSDIGAVGGKIILPDGTLQEAGSIVWRDGSCLGYGRGDSPSAPPYMFKRDVDYCSGAFLLTKRDLFLDQGGFDEDYAPAYYEETDYCVRLWQQNKRVVYDPNAIILHYEFASSTSSNTAINLQVEHKNVFATKHKNWLQSQCKPEAENILIARTHRREGQRRILFLDDRVPHLALGSGFPRSNRILLELVNMRQDVTFYPTNFPNEDWADVYQDIPREVEVMLNHGWDKLEEFLEERANYYDLILVSRPHNMTRLKSLLATKPDLCRKSKIVYDAEALFSFREIEQLRLEGKALSAVEQQKLIDEEVLLAENCESVISVSGRESHEFSKRGLRHVHTLSHALDISPTENDFAQRRDILFVGSVHSLTSPNADSMYWFSEKILPLVQAKLGSEVRLVIAGSAIPSFFERFPNGNVKLVGQVDQLATYYNDARLFVAPTRFSAGIPLKVIEAAAHGLPVVATKLSGLQLGWREDHDLLLADDPEAFAAACITLYQDRDLWKRLRQNALRRVKQEYSPAGFSAQLKKIIGSVHSA